MSIDYLEQAREAVDWSEDDSIDSDGALWFFAKAKAYAAIATAEAAIRQAAALERIADMLPQIHDALYAPDAVSGGMESVAQYASWIYDK